MQKPLRGVGELRRVHAEAHEGFARGQFPRRPGECEELHHARSFVRLPGLKFLVLSGAFRIRDLEGSGLWSPILGAEARG